MNKAPSNLESNIGQIFVKENTLTKQIKGKLQESTLSKDVVMFGCHFGRKEVWVLAVLCLLFFISFIGMVIMWWTSSFDNYVLSHFILFNNSAAFLRWKKPPVSSLLKIHIFNYTNVEEYQKGLVDKLHVEDIGPFVYEESTQRTNIKFHPNSSISYQEFHSHTFRPDLSQNRTETDLVIVPNLAVLGAAAANQEAFYVTRLAVSAVLRGLDADPFLNLDAYRFIWGYDDKLFELAKTVYTFQKKLPFEKFGIMAARNGTSDDVITVQSGINDLSRIAQIEKVNGEEYLNYWGSADCNRIKGSDGASYPIYEVRQKMPVNIYFREMCRHVPLVFNKTVKHFDGEVEAYRYTMPDTVFDRPDLQPENQCYCDEITCPPQGVFNISKCAFGAPASISFPHFYKADPVLQNGVTGLNPTKEEHSSYMDLHPQLGFPMGGIYKLQFNFQVKKSFGMSQLDMFDDDMYLPIAWIEAGIDPIDLPPAVKDHIFLASITLPTFEKTLKYGILLFTMSMFVGVVYIFARKFQEQRSRKRIDFPQISIVYS